MKEGSKEGFWVKMLEISGHGTNVVGLRAGQLLDKAERDAFDAIYTEVSGIVGINDCFLDFHLSTIGQLIREISRTNERAEPRDFLAFCHLEAFHRFRAAHLLLARGHYTEAIDLCPGLWENILTIIAVATGIVTIAELFGGIQPADRPIDNQEGRKIIRAVREVDNTIQKRLIWDRPDLSESAKERIRGMVALMHMTVHKSRLSLICNLRTWYDGSQPISALPQFDMEFAQVCGNLLLFDAWCVTRTCRFFDFLFEPKPDLDCWQDNFAKLDGLLVKLVKGTPNPTARAIEELVQIHLSPK